MVLDVWVAGHGFEYDGLEFVVPRDIDGAADYFHGAQALGTEHQGRIGDLQVWVVQAVPDAIVEGLAEGAEEEKVAGQPSPVVSLDHVGPIEVGVLQVDETNGDFVVVPEQLLGTAFLGLVGADPNGVEVVAEAAALLLVVAKAQAVEQTRQGATSIKGDYTSGSIIRKYPTGWESNQIK